MCKKKEDEYALQISPEYSLYCSTSVLALGSSIRLAVSGFYGP